MDQFKQILKQYWGYDDFRGIQRNIIESIASGRDTLGLMPTGGGKSITFQVPALAMEGLCLVVTPLIALMKDQVDNLLKHDIRATAIHSGLSREEIVRRLDNAVLGAYKFLYVSPERLVTSIFMNKVQRMRVCLLTVDEAHCISQWGYDFRPHYLRIAEVRKLLPGVPVLALTATATPKVVDDIQQRLTFATPNVFRMSFARANLHYVVRRVDSKIEEMVHILQSVEGSAVVYTRSRRLTREVAETLESEGISALYYHAGLTSLDKDVRQLSWQRDEVRVMVATNAFGMGIDKPDVRLVIHLDVPDSIEAYYQEAGRAGRDGNPAYAVLLCDRYDAMKLKARVPQTFPDRAYIRKVYADLSSFFQVAEGEAEGRTFDFNIDKFCRTFKHHPIMLVSALHLLTRAGYIHFSLEDANTSRVMFLVCRDELYGINYLNADEEQLLNMLMRQSGGLFADYVTIDESQLAERCNLTSQQVYEKLCHLTRLRILHYVPHKEVPQLTYTTRRVDTNYVQIGRDIYEDRRADFEKRIDAMIAYFTHDDECRSRYLLRYFADDGKDCGCCDVCLARKAAPEPQPSVQLVGEVCSHLLQILSDGQSHAPVQLWPANTPDAVCRAALEQLLRAGMVEWHDSNLRLTQE